MKRLLWILTVMVILATVLLPSVIVYADTSKDVTVTANPRFVTVFTAIYINDYEVDLYWPMPVDAVSATIRASDNAYPVDCTDGYGVYYGAGVSTSDTAVNFYESLGKKYYAIWYQDIDGDWLATTYHDDVEGGAMIDLVTQAALLNTFLLQTLPLIVGFAIIALITGLAYWHRDRWLYVLSGLGFFALIPAYLSAAHNIYLGIVIGVAGVYQFIKAFLE